MATWMFGVLAQVAAPSREVALITAVAGVLGALIAAIPTIVTARRTKRRLDELLEEEGRKALLSAILVQLALDPPTAQRLRDLLFPGGGNPPGPHDDSGVDIERIAQAMAAFDRAKRRRR
jgi:hypothetical protein